MEAITALRNANLGRNSQDRLNNEADVAYIPILTPNHSIYLPSLAIYLYRIL